MEKNKGTGAMRITLITLVILLVGVFLIGFVSAEKTTYTPTTTTVCEGITCTATLYSGVQNVYEDEKWVDIERAVSLKNSGAYEVKVLENDEEYPLEVLDYNMTSITLDLKHWSLFTDEIDIRIWKANETKEAEYMEDVLLGNVEKSALESSYKSRFDQVTHGKESFNVFDLGSKVVNYNVVPGDIIEFGPNSTTIVLQTANSENLEDAGFFEDASPVDYSDDNFGENINIILNDFTTEHREGIIKFNISSIPPTTSTINAANLTMYMYGNELDAGESYRVNVHKVYPSFNWDEHTITWDTKPDSGTEYNSTVEDYVIIGEGGAVYAYWDIPEMTQDIISSNSKNLSIYLGVSNGNGGTDDGSAWASKEHTTSAWRPKLVIEYSINYPSATITYPATGSTPTSVVNHFNWTYTNFTTLDDCLYSLDGAANVSVTCTDKYKALTPLGEGAHTILFTLNDSAGLMNWTLSSFTQNVASPTATISYPVNAASYSTAINHFNWTKTNGTTLDICRYSLNGAANVSLTCTDDYKAFTPGDGIHTLIVSINDTLGQGASDTNTFTQDTTAPVINVTYPYGTITNETVGHTLYFNWTATDATSSLSSCWYNYNNTNTTVTCGDQNITFVTNIIGQRNITFYANDTLNNVANYTRYWDYKFLERSRTFNYTSYETTTDYYKLNISSDGTQVVTAQLWYNNTNYTATKVGSNKEMTFTSQISHPWGESGNQTFYWTVKHGATLINTTSDGQFISPLQFGVCNATLVTPFINFTFKDEGTDTFTNSTFEVYNWFYYVGDGSQNKTFDYVNTTEQESYSFCFNTNVTVHNNASIDYKSSTHPERTYSQTTDLTNNTEYVVLYLLSSADGQYVIFQAQDQYGTTINGATISIEKEFAGSWVFLGEDLTDSAGSATFFLNPDDNHRITVTKTGYTPYTSIIRPTQSSYTIVLSSGETSSTDFLWEGIRYNTYPKTGTILAPNTSYDFGFNVTGIIGNITGCKLTITNSSFHEIGSATGCTAYGGNINLNLGTGDNQKLFGNYYINFGSGYELLKSNDAWMVEMVNISSSGAYVWELMEKFVNYEEFGTGNKAEFNRITFFFILLVLGLGLFTKTTNVEMTNPGTTLMILWGIITLFSFVGLFAVEGIIRNGWLNKYAIWLMTSFLTWGFILNYWRRNAS